MQKRLVRKPSTIKDNEPAYKRLEQAIKCTLADSELRGCSKSHLKKKGLIKHTTSKTYMNRQYPRSWLTDLGVLLAIHEGAKAEVLLKTTREIYPHNKDLHFLIEAAPILGKHALDVLYLAVLNRGEINQTDLIAIFASQLQNKLNPKQIRQFTKVLKKYPERHQQTRKNLKELYDLL